MSRGLPWKRLLSWLLVGAALAFLGAEVARQADAIRAYRWQVRPGLLALSVAGMAAVFLWGIVLWQLVLRQLGVRAGYRALARAWFLANLTRYIPGMIWQFVSLARLGSAAGMAPATSVTGILVQMGFLLLAALATGAYLLPLALAGPLEGLVVALRWAAPLALLAVHPAVIRAALRLASRAARRETLPWNASWAVGLGLLALAAATWLLYGLAFWLFVRSLVALPAGALPTVTAANALAFVAGYLAFFAPGGLGYKEGALALLLAGLMPRPVAVAVALAARLWTIAAELLPALFFLRAAPRDRVARTPDAAEPR